MNRERSTSMSTSWLQNIASSSPPAPVHARAASTDATTPTPIQQARKATMFVTPAQLGRKSTNVETPFTIPQARKSTSPIPRDSPHHLPFNASSIDPSLQSPSQTHQDLQTGLEPPPSTQRRAVSGKQPRRHDSTDTGDRSHSSSGDEEDEDLSSSEDETVLAKRRRLAQTTGEKLGLSTKSISDAKQFAGVSPHPPLSC